MSPNVSKNFQNKNVETIYLNIPRGPQKDSIKTIVDNDFLVPAQK